MKYFIEVWGCQMNEHDAEALGGILESMGFLPGTAEEADLILLHTCCIRAKAEDKVLGRIGMLAKEKRRGRNRIIAVGGCMTQQEDVAASIRKRFPEVDIIFGTHNLHDFGSLLVEVLGSRGTVSAISSGEAMVIREQEPIRRGDPYKAYVNIIYGCNNFCAYCIVPYVRGRERSRRPEEILREVRGLLEQGYKEITLLGQNVNSYGKDLEDGPDFAGLLKLLDPLGDYRLRFMSPHPRDFSRQLADVIRESRNVCHQFHLPLQSGSSRIIGKMNRGYSKEHYLDLVSYIRETMPEATLSTDIIVGFPGETEEDFQDTLDVVRQVGYDLAFMFQYSPREGTKAAGMAEQIPEEVKKERFARLLALQNENSRMRNAEMIGKTYEVLVEAVGEPGTLLGRTRGNKVISFQGTPGQLGTLVQVMVTAGNTWSLRGEACSSAEL